MPGLYLPGRSNLMFDEGLDVYNKEQGHLPPTVVDLNAFIERTYPFPILNFDPALHTNVPPFSPSSGNFYQMIGLPLELPDKDKNKTKPYNWDTARMKLNLNHDLMKPLVKYLANPLLTTVPFSKELDSIFIGLGIKSPFNDGWFICNTKSFPTMKGLRITPYTPINICSFCKGLALLPSHRMNFVYYVPYGLKYISQEIIEAWNSSLLTVCTVHFLHRSVRMPDLLISNLKPSF